MVGGLGSVVAEGFAFGVGSSIARSMVGSLLGDSDMFGGGGDGGGGDDGGYGDLSEGHSGDEWGDDVDDGWEDGGDGWGGGD